MVHTFLQIAQRFDPCQSARQVAKFTKITTLIRLETREKGLSEACVQCCFSSETTLSVFVAFVAENATLSSKGYFENHISSFCAKPKEVDPIKLISLRQISVSIAHKYIINNTVLK